VSPLRAPYIPPEYQKRWHPNEGRPLDTLLAPYRKRRDRTLFKLHLDLSDIFLVGHPKSGNTWLAYMLAILIRRDFGHQITLSNIGEYIPVVHGRDRKIAKYSNLPKPRVFRNEWPVHPDLYPKVVYLVRDPRAVLVSYYHMYRTITPDCEMSIRAFVEEYLSHGCIWNLEPLVRWDRQVLVWKKRAEREGNVMIVKYEDMVIGRAQVLKGLIKFGEIPCTQADLDIAVARGSFELMRKDEEKHGAESYPGAVGKRGRFIRRGKIDGWKDEMDLPTLKQIERELGAAMKAMGYQLQTA